MPVGTNFPMGIFLALRVLCAMVTQIFGFRRIFLRAARPLRVEKSRAEHHLQPSDLTVLSTRNQI